MDKWNHWLLTFVILVYMVLSTSTFSMAQELKTITGKVFDANTNEPIPNVNIKLKSSSSSVTTNQFGAYSLKGKNTDILIFSYLGYDTREIEIGGKSTINITLNTNLNSLDEVIVIGYGTTVKKDLTGSVGIVDVKTLTHAPVASFDQALAGRVAGVQVSSDGGQPGSEGINIVIRGNGSLTQSNSPLYVVDGFPIEDFENGSLNNDDIESINVLKDASATAIYGARGANGVIIIETKKGKIGAPVTTYGGSAGFHQVIRKMEMMNPYEFVKHENEMGRGASYLTSDRTLESYRDVKGIDWQDQLFRKGVTQIHNIAIRGGTEQTRYSVSGSIYNGNAIIINSGYDRYQGRFSLDQTFNKKLKAGVNLNYSSQSSFGREASSGSSASRYLLYAALGYRPITGNIDSSLEDFENSIIDDEVNSLEDYRVNPIISTQNEHRYILKNNLVVNAYTTYEIIPGLILKITGGINDLGSQSEFFYNSKTASGTSLIPSNTRGQWGAKSYSDRISLSNENTLTYRKRINKNHSYDIMTGISFQESNIKTGGFTSINVPNESLGVNGLGQGTPIATPSGASVFTLQSYLSRANYDYKSKYLFTISFRADGSSKFINDNKWSYFPSAAFAWRMSKESFMKTLGFVSDAKLRISYGQTGNNRVGDFVVRSILDPSNNSAYSYGNEDPTQGVAISNIGNSKLKWETTEQIDLGYDLSLFKNRVELNLDVYNKTTRDLLINANMPYHTGYPLAYKNVGKVQNRGIELTLNTVNIRNKNFSWESSFNISFNKNKILALSEGENTIINNIIWETAYNNSPLYISKIGQRAGDMYGYIWDGIYQYSDFDETAPGTYILKSGVTTNNNDRANINVKPGDIKYRDLNGDRVINQYDQTTIGRGLPIHIGGLSNNFTYKGINLGVFLQWSYGNNVFNANRLVFEGSTRARLNQFASYVNRWTAENQSNEYYRIGGQGPAGTYSSKVVEDGSYLRLKTLYIGYDIPTQYLSIIKIKKLSLTVSAQNLFTWTNYSGFDPEVSTRNSTLTPGFDFSAYPHPRTIVFGLKASL